MPDLSLDSADYAEVEDCAASGGEQQDSDERQDLHVEGRRSGRGAMISLAGKYCVRVKHDERPASRE